MSDFSFVYSTLSCNQAYTQWDKAPEGGFSTRLGSIRIVGMANIANKNFFTPKGAATRVSSQQLEILNKNESFLRHQKAGYITVEAKEMKTEKVVQNMEPKDKSSPLTSKDYKRQPKTGKD